MLLQGVASAVVNVVVLAVLPLLVYAAVQRFRHGRPLPEVARRAGLAAGDARSLAMGGAFALVGVLALVVFPPPLDVMVREGSPQRGFAGLGLAPALPLALLYGFVKTGFAEEVLFRGLIGGSLSRRLPSGWANLGQALVFLAPHLLVLRVMPELWPLLVVVFLGALFVGWLRIRSGSIAAAWLVHGSLNFATCLSVAARTAA